MARVGLALLILSCGGCIGGGGTSGAGGRVASGKAGGSGAVGSGGATGVASGTGGSCTSLVASGAQVYETAGSGTAPTAAGGTILSGTYELTSWVVYAPATPTTTRWRQVALRITGSTLEGFGTDSTSAAPSTVTASIGTSGSRLTMSYTCGSGATGYGYTATDTDLVLFNPRSGGMEVRTYTRDAGSSGTGGSAGGASGSAGSPGGRGGGAGSGGAAGTSGAGGSAGNGGAGGAAGAGGTAAVCSSLVASGAQVYETAGSGTAPTAAGGTILSGTYQLTSWVVYAPATPTTTRWRQVALRITGSTLEIFGMDSTSAAPSTVTASIGTSGSTLTVSYTCGSGTSGYGYTATSTDLVFFNPRSGGMEVRTYTRDAGSSGTGGGAGGASGSGGGTGGSAGGASGSRGGTGGSAGGASGSGGSTGGSGGGGSGGGAGASGAGAAGKGGAGGAAGAGGTAAMCSSLLGSGAQVYETAGSGTPPTAAGGTILNGTYELTSWVVYAPATPTTTRWRQVALRITGSNLEIFGMDSTSAAPSTVTASIGTSSATLTVSYTCGSGAGSYGYSATSTDLVLFNPRSGGMEVRTYNWLNGTVGGSGGAGGTGGTGGTGAAGRSGG